MAQPILYKPAPRWQFWSYLGGALLIHAVAVVAAIKHEPPPMDLSQIPSAEVIATLETPTDEPTPPPEDIPLPEPPPMPEIQPEFHEETTPPPKRPLNAKVAPIKAPQAARPSGVMSISSAKALAINSPRPEYPYEARSRHITGSGVCVVSVDASGTVTDATMAQSIGNPILDNSATNAFRRWRFKAGVAPKVKIPITFTMTGASY
ncbi:MAG: energy transducer TonB [Verrucomicrobiota bacterium]|nr:energy transducer TonB [Verrucomicrobiota bacterium]